VFIRKHQLSDSRCQHSALTFQQNLINSINWLTADC
jgi:hypothetical protein